MTLSNNSKQSENKKTEKMNSKKMNSENKKTKIIKNKSNTLQMNHSNNEKFSVLKLFLRMMSYKPGLYTVNCTLWTLIHVTPLFLGLIFKEFFNMLVKDDKFTINLISLIIVTFVYKAGRMFNIYWGAKADNLHRFTMSALLRRNMFDGILKKPGAVAVPCSQGEALNCFRDDAETIENSISWTLDFIGNVVFVIVALSIMININMRLTLFVFTPLVAVVGIVQMLSSKLRKYRKASREATGLVTGAMGEIFGAVQSIKVAGEEDHVIHYLENLNKKRHKMMVKDTLLTQTLHSIFYNTVSIGTGFILLLTANSMKSGNITIGELSLFIYYLDFISDFTSFFGSFIANNRQAKISFKRIADLMQEPNPEAAVKHTPIYLHAKDMSKVKDTVINNIEANKLDTIHIKDLNYKYPSSGNGIEGVNFSLEKGSFTVITGRIGSGKSTLLKVLLGLLPAQKGGVYWNENEIKELDNFFISPNSSYTPQIPNSFLVQPK